MSNYWESDLQFPREDGQPNAAPQYNPDEQARAAQQTYANRYAQSPYARAAVQPESTPPAPNRPHRRAGFAVALCAVCILLSLGCGFLGTYAANRWFPPAQQTQDAGNDGASLIDAPLHTGTADSKSDSLSAVIEATKDSVVEITTESVSTSTFFGQYVTRGAGSGVIVRADGYIVTNNHVISGANTINVTLTNGESYTATLVGSDSKTDLAVLKIDAAGLVPAVFGNSADVQVGDVVVAIGNPLGSLGGTVTDGIISALDREILVQNQSMTLLQTSAAINPGNSGGGLFNVYGELVGVVNAKPSDNAAGTGSSIDGLGFAIPVDTVREVVSQLIDNGYVSGRPAMGVTVLYIGDAQTARQYGVSRYGVYIVSLVEDMGAEAAGLQAGDCIMSIDGAVVSSTADVTAALDAHEVGDSVEVQVIRDDRILTVSVQLMENAAQQAG